MFNTPYNNLFVHVLIYMRILHKDISICWLTMKRITREGYKSTHTQRALRYGGADIGSHGTRWQERERETALDTDTAKTSPRWWPSFANGRREAEGSIHIAYPTTCGGIIPEHKQLGGAGGVQASASAWSWSADLVMEAASNGTKSSASDVSMRGAKGLCGAVNR
jgi:hypothetical protein